jgi:hypothetical protein
MFPLFGILFLIALSDIFVGLVSLCFKRTRVFAAYLLLCPLFGTFLSFWLFWGGGFLVEYVFDPTRWSTWCFLGYTDGFAPGAFAGFYVARKINRRLFA